MIWAIDNTVSRASGGRLSVPNGSRGTLRTLFLHTIGRTTGRPRRNGLYSVEDGANLVVVASNAGEDVDPAWWCNLQAQPDADVEIRSAMRPVRARLATPAEAGPLYERFAAAIPTYAEYRERASRPIPVVILEPR